MNNSALGKRMEYLRKKINVRLVNNARGLKYVSKTTFISQKIFSEILLLFTKLNWL